jgi:GTP-binding protein HflX
MLHVVDCSHPRARDQISAVESVLTSLGVIETPRLIVWNKVDLLPQGMNPPALLPSHHNFVAVSAKMGLNLEALLQKTDSMLAEGLVDLELLIPWDSYKTVSGLYGLGTIVEREETEEGVRMKVSVPAALTARLTAFIKK